MHSIVLMLLVKVMTVNNHNHSEGASDWLVAVYFKLVIIGVATMPYERWWSRASFLAYYYLRGHGVEQAFRLSTELSAERYRLIQKGPSKQLFRGKFQTTQYSVPPLVYRGFSKPFASAPPSSPALSINPAPPIEK